jgi:hypothetical protein
MSKEVLINLNESKRVVTISVPIKEYSYASQLADTISNLSYLKVYERTILENESLTVEIKAFTIPTLFTVEKMEEDLVELIHLMDMTDEENQ